MNKWPNISQYRLKPIGRLPYMVVSSLGCVLFWFYSPYRSFQFVLIFGCVLTHSYTHSFLHFAYTQAVSLFSLCPLSVVLSFGCVPTQSFFHSPVLSVTHLLVRLCPPSHTHVLTRVFTHVHSAVSSFCRAPIRLCPHSVMSALACALTHSPPRSFVSSLTYSRSHPCLYSVWTQRCVLNRLPSPNHALNSPVSSPSHAPRSPVFSLSSVLLSENSVQQ